MDNNGDILQACVEPRTAEQLDASGIRHLRSQLELLRDWHLLEYDGASKTYRTTVHVYGPRAASAIRDMVGPGAAEVTGKLDADPAALRRHLGETRREKSLFAVLYAYVLHGYSMSRFSEEIYQKPQLSAERPFWNGYAWAISRPDRSTSLSMQLPVRRGPSHVLGATAVRGPDPPLWMRFAKDVAADRRSTIRSSRPRWPRSASPTEKGS